MFLLVLPVALLLLALGLAGFIDIRASLLDQWRRSVLLGMERAAHSIDMNLARPAQALELLRGLEPMSSAGIEQWETALATIPGVVGVDLELTQAAGAGASSMAVRPGMGSGQGHGRMSGQGSADSGFARMLHRVRIASVSGPSYQVDGGREVVDMVYDLEDRQGKRLGRLRVSLGFEYLIHDVKGLYWWKSKWAYVVDSQGRILAHTPNARHREGERLGEDGDQLELATLRAMKRSPSGTVLGPGIPAKMVSAFYRLEQAPWTIVTFAPGEQVLGPIIKLMRRYVVVGFFCVVLVVLLIRLVTGRMVRSIREVSQAAREVARGRYRKVPPQPGRDEIARLVEDFNTMVEGLEERDYIRDTFGRYMDPEVARQLMKHPEATDLGGRQRRVAIMMTDVRGYTTLCQALSPQQTIEVINGYLSVLIEAIQKHGGIIVDFLGDAVLAFFDTLDETPEQAARRAVCCALEIQRATEEFNRSSSQQGLPQLKTGIGLVLGEVVVGNIGSRTRTKYGIVGGSVNLASRIQGQARGGEVLVDASLYQALEAELVVERSFEVRLKGLDRPQRLYAVTADSSCGPEV